MVQSPSWAANWFAASQEIPRISRNPKVHYRTHNRPPTVSKLSQPNPVHIPTSHLLEIRPNIIHPSTPRSPQCSLSLRFPQQEPIHPLSSPTRATCPAHRKRIMLLLINALFTYFYTFYQNLQHWKTKSIQKTAPSLAHWLLCVLHMWRNRFVLSHSAILLVISPKQQCN